MRQRQESYIYFIRHVPSDCVKIGRSRLPKQRLSGLRVAHPNPDDLQPIAAVPGGGDIERELHERFADARKSGEWFEPVPEIEEYIETVTSAFTYSFGDDTMHDLD